MGATDEAIDAIDDRVIALDTTKANQSDLLLCVKTVTYNSTTGIIALTWQNGSTLNIDLPIEKIPVSFSMDENGIITMTNADGTTYTADIGSLIKTYNFVDSDQIDFTATLQEDGSYNVIGIIKGGSITDAMLESGYLASITEQANSASTSSQNATARATLAESYAKGGTNTRTGEDTDNAKYYSDRASAFVDVDIATTSKAGIVKPDGTTITIDTNGLINAPGGHTHLNKATLDSITETDLTNWNGKADIGDIQELETEISDLKAFIGYTDGDIYGVEVDFTNRKITRIAGAVNKTPGAAFNEINAFGGRKRCIITDDGDVLAYYGEAAYTETGSLIQAVTVGGVTHAVGTKVQVMVEQPKFYYKVVPLALDKVEGGKGFHMRKARYYVSDTMKTGFKIHPAFVSNGKENNFIYMSAYEGCTFDTSASAYKLNDAQDVDWTNDVLASICGAKPTSGLTQSGATRAGFRTIAAKRGSGWSQETVQAATATELLFLVEYASFDTQSKIGIGVTNKTDDGATSMTEITGATTTLGNATGFVVNTNGWNVVSYRGEENPYGNIWKWIDGINIYNYNEGSVHIADHGFVDNSKADPYKDAGITIAGANGYVSAFAYNEDFDWLFIASEVLGNSSLPVGDYFYQNKATSAYAVAILGGSCDSGSSAGGFCWSVVNPSSHRARFIGGRLVYVPSNAA